MSWRDILDRFTVRDPLPAPIPLWAAEIAALCGHILTRMESIMSDQDTLNTFVANLETAISALSTEIKTLQNQPVATPLDWTAANKALSDLQALETPAPAPAPEPTPAPGA